MSAAYPQAVKKYFLEIRYASASSDKKRPMLLCQHRAAKGT